jgi:hypothetical protein
MSLLDLINKERQKLQRGNNNRPEKLQSERNLVRILPCWDGDPDAQFHQYWGQHFIKDNSGAIKAVYICTQQNFGEPCGVCEAIAQGAAMTSDEDTLKVLKDARASNRVLVNALYLKGGKHDAPETTPVVLDLPPSVFDAILSVYQTYHDEGINVFDLEAGYNFLIEKTGTGMNTEYKVSPMPKSTKVDKAVLTKAKNLTEWARQESEEGKNKAITSVKVLSGQPMGAPVGTAARLAGPAREESKLARVNPDDVIDADFVDMGIKGGNDGLDDFLDSLA